MTDMLQEFCDSRGVAIRVDRQAGVIHGVKILGLESRNGRTYMPEALAQAVRLYEDAKVNVNHPKGHPTGPRDYQDRIGAVRRVAVRDGEGLFGDLHFNPKHALAEQLIWDAEHAPENVGFSHNVEARVSRRGDRVVVEAITRVQSVDLVADPATTRGLFESATDTNTATSESNIAKATPATSQASAASHETAQPSQEAEVARLRREVEQLREQEAARHKQAAANRLLREFGLPDTDAGDSRAQVLTSRLFLESLLAAPDEASMRALVEDRAALVRALTEETPAQSGHRVPPQSRDQHAVYAGMALNGKSFVEAIT